MLFKTAAQQLQKRIPIQMIAFSKTLPCNTCLRKLKFLRNLFNLSSYCPIISSFDKHLFVSQRNVKREKIFIIKKAKKK